MRNEIFLSLLSGEKGKECFKFQREISENIMAIKSTFGKGHFSQDLLQPHIDKHCKFALAQLQVLHFQVLQGHVLVKSLIGTDD